MAFRPVGAVQRLVRPPSRAAAMFAEHLQPGARAELHARRRADRAGRDPSPPPRRHSCDWSHALASAFDEDGPVVCLLVDVQLANARRYVDLFVRRDTAGLAAEAVRLVADADTGRSTVDAVLGLRDFLDRSEPPRRDALRNGRNPNVRRRLFAERADRRSTLSGPVHGNKRTDPPSPLIVGLVADLVAAPGAPQLTPACGQGSF